MKGNFSKQKKISSIDMVEVLELARAQLKEDIDFLYDTYDNYLGFRDEQKDVRSLEIAILVLVKSMKYNHEYMQKEINKFYTEGSGRNGVI